MSLVQVRLHDLVVGTIERFDDELDTHTFSWDPEYLSHPDRPVLGQYMEDRLRGPVTTHGLTPWFEHLLPQGPLRAAIARDAGIELSDGLGLLSWLGADLPGAVAVDVVRALRQRPRTRTPLTAAPPESHYKASLPGAQWKLSLQGTAKGLTLPMRGVEGDCIGKFHAELFHDVVRVENATMDWASLVGINVPPHRLADYDAIENLPSDVPRGSGAVYVIDRFDRTKTGRVHVEDFGQVFDRPPGPSQYRGTHEEIGAFLAALCPSDCREYLLRVVFCCMVGNGDAHLKNWALLYPDAHHARTSPAYDLVPTIIYNPRDQLALSLGGTRQFLGMSPERFGHLATAMNLPRGAVYAWVRDDAARIHSQWERGVRAMFSGPQRARIEKHFKAVHGLWGADGA